MIMDRSLMFTIAEVNKARETVYSQEREIHITVAGNSMKMKYTYV